MVNNITLDFTMWILLPTTIIVIANTRQIHQMSFETQNPLEHFSTFANQDVEMQAPLAENSFYLVPDTNILLHYLDTLATFADDIEKLPNCNVVIVIPTCSDQRARLFSEWNIAYTEDSVVVPEISRDDNEMDVDTENLHNEQEILPKDARILLHLQVIDIFVGLLRELVAADQRDVQRKSAEGASASVHAPSIVASIHALNRDANVSEMSLGVLLSWVTDSPSGRLPLQADNPPLSYFLTKPYQKHTGSRPGMNGHPRIGWFLSESFV
ncbi:hypothetical protein BT96DRAFT_1020985 [Gymnopus androsaceus JB14]|uniref:PIN domain-containing protein n=1 Tax=Gymnopus androsaceus JB14 TaxID=1447944 RepID=A0A6A4HHX0_9AGAR|nr:hypothetical protein BT96DRAFT_1020985 [Gymnopus androsaceus JB14]